MRSTSNIEISSVVNYNPQFNTTQYEQTGEESLSILRKAKIPEKNNWIKRQEPSIGGTENKARNIKYKELSPNEVTCILTVKALSPQRKKRIV